MMMFVKLTDLGGGSFGLPVIGSPFRDNISVVDDEGNQYPRTIWKLWTTAELNALGYAPFTEKNFDQVNYRSTGTTDMYADGEVTRTHTTTLAKADVLKRRKLDKLKAYRKQKETGGAIWSPDAGVTLYAISTDDESQRKTVGAKVHMDSTGKPDRKWTVVDSNGDKVRITVTKQEFKALGEAVGDHVDATYDAEEAHLAAINALTTSQEVYDYDFTQDIVDSEWPVNPSSE